MSGRGATIDRWDDATLDRLAEISDEDIEAAVLAWRRDVEPRFRDLIDAVDVDIDE